MGGDHLGGGAGPGGGLEHDQTAGGEEDADHGGGSLDGAEVGRPVGQRRRHGDDRNVERAQLVGARDDVVTAAVERGLHDGGGNVLDMGAAGRQRVGFGGVGVEPGDVKSGGDGGHRDGKTDVALADEQYVHHEFPVVEFPVAPPGPRRRRCRRS
jgi:hypothetical protein